jgi:hypothetical protein
MKVCRWFGSLLVVVGLVALVGPKLSVLAQGKDDVLVWKAFDADTKEWYQTLETTTDQTMSVQGMKVDQKQKQTFYIKWSPQKAEKGKWVVKQRIVGVKMSIDIGGNKIDYDSTIQQPNNPMTDFFKALQTLDLTFTIKQSDMSIEKIEGNKEFIAALSKTNPQMEPLLKSILSEDALKKMAEPTLFAFPPDGKLSKKTWDRTSDLDLGPIGKYTTKYTFAAVGKGGKNKDLDKIDVKATMSYKPPTDAGGLPFKIKSGTLEGKDGTGEALFNPKLGRFDSYTMKMKLEGKLTIDIGGMVTDVDLTQDQTATVTSSNDNPVPEKKGKN